MTPSTLSPRESGTKQSMPVRQGFFDTTCKPGTSRFKWCPVDVALWVIVICIILLICWKVYITNRVGPNSPGQRKKSNRDLHCRLELPQAEELLDSSKQHYCTYEYKLEGGHLHGSSGLDHCDILDNPQVPNNVPQISHSVVQNHNPKSRGRPSTGVGLGIDLKQDSPQSKDWESEYPETGRYFEKIVTPVPAHVRSPHWGP